MKKPDLDNDCTLLFHGTSGESAMSILKEGFSSRETLWNASYGDRVYMVIETYELETKDYYEPDQIRNIEDFPAYRVALDASRSAKAKYDEQDDTCYVFMFAMPKNAFDDILFPDTSTEAACLTDDYYEIMDMELNKAINDGRVKCWLLTIDNSYYHQFRLFYLPSDTTGFKMPDDLERIPCIQHMLSCINKEPEVFDALFDEAPNQITDMQEITCI